MGAGALSQAHDLGVSVSLDYISRRLLVEGGLARMVSEDHVVGVTSNPIIFGKAISQDSLYEAQLRDLDPGLSPEEAAQVLMVRDIQDAADTLRPVYDATSHRDGFVSLEVSPHLAHSHAGTVAAARALWDRVDRPNLLIKMPATAEGIAAFEDCVAGGIAVNITVIFSANTYEAVVRAYVRAMQRRHDAELSLDVATYASVFVGRLDPPIDALLDDRISASTSPDQRARLEALRGRGALANAELVYERSRELEAALGPALTAIGARFQPIIWASVGARGDTPPTKYVNGLLSPGSTLTMPEATLDAFRAGGDTTRPMGTALDEARAVWSALTAEGINPDRITGAMEEEILHLFSEAYDGMCAEVASKLAELRPVPAA